MKMPAQVNEEVFNQQCLAYSCTQSDYKGAPESHFLLWKKQVFLDLTSNNLFWLKKIHYHAKTDIFLTFMWINFLCADVAKYKKI